MLDMWADYGVKLMELGMPDCVLGVEEAVMAVARCLQNPVMRTFMVDRMKEFVKLSDDYKGEPPAWAKTKISRLHKEIDDLRLHAERKCRKIMTPAAPFGPEVKYWYNRIHALKSMKRMLLNPDAKFNRSHNYLFASHLMERP